MSDERRERVRRFFQAFDWKLVASVTMLLVVVLFGVSYINQSRIIDSRGQSIAANRVDRAETRAIIRDLVSEVADLDEQADARSKEASKQRAKLERQIEVLTRLLRQNGIPVPADTSRAASAPATRSSQPSASSPTRSRASSTAPRSSQPSSGGGSAPKPAANPKPAPAPAPAPSPTPKPQPAGVCVLNICLP